MNISIIINAATARIYMLAPIVIPVVTAQNIYIRSSGSLIAVRYLTMERAPTIPSEITIFVLIASVTMLVSTVIPTSVSA